MMKMMMALITKHKKRKINKFNAIGYFRMNP